MSFCSDTRCLDFAVTINGTEVIALLNPEKNYSLSSVRKSVRILMRNNSTVETFKIAIESSYPKCTFPAEHQTTNHF